MTCPACWSTLDSGAVECPHCGTRLKRKTLRWVPAVLALLALAAVGGAWAWYAGRGEAEDKSAGAEVETGQPTVRDVDPVPDDRARPRTRDDRTFFDGVLLRLAHRDARSGRRQFCAATEAVREALVRQDWNASELEVLHWDPDSPLTLLVGPGDGPGVEIRDHATLPEGAALHGTLDSAPLRLASSRKTFAFDRSLEHGELVLDADGRAIALGWNGDAMPLAPLLRFRSEFVGEPLDGVRQRIRATDPKLALADARGLLESRDLDVDGAASAIEMLTTAQYQARDRDLIEAIQATLVRAHRARVRILSATDGPAALRQAQESLSLLGSPPGILADATLLALIHGSAEQALHWYAALASASLEDAQGIRSKVLSGIERRASALLRAGARDEAARLLELATARFPEDETLRRLATAATTRTTGRRVEIPLDANHQALTKGSAGGVALAFLVDTGASNTTIPRSVAAALGLLDGRNPVVKVETAGGIVEAPQVVIPKITIAGRITVTQVEAVVLDLPGGLRDKGLLGMNVLRRLSVRIDNRRGKLILGVSRDRR